MVILFEKIKLKGVSCKTLKDIYLKLNIDLFLIFKIK